MTHTARIPKEQAGSADEGGRCVVVAATADRLHQKAGVGSVQPDDTEGSSGIEGRFGNLKQNLMNQWKVQESSAVART